MTVITYLDMLKTEKDKRKAFDKACQATGGPGDRTYFITNYTHERNETSFAVDLAALDILDSTLLSAERFILISKQKERNRLEREAMAAGKILRFYAHTSYRENHLSPTPTHPPTPLLSFDSQKVFFIWFYVCFYCKIKELTANINTTVIVLSLRL